MEFGSGGRECMIFNNLNVAFLFFEDREISTYPSIINSAKILSKKGCKIKVFVPPMMSPFPSIVNTEFVPSGKNDVKSYIRFVSKNTGDSDLIIAFSIEGLFVSAKRFSIFNKNNIPVVYFSMELVYQKYFTKTIRKIGIRTGFFTITRLCLYLKLMLFGKNFVKFGVAQDEKRCELLKEEFPFIKETVVVPNSYIGFNGGAPKIDMKEKFNIPENKKILLFAGGFCKELGYSLNDIFEKLDDDYVLFLNVYSRDGSINEVKRSFASDIKKGRMVVNDETLNESEYLDLVKSSHIGIIWYTEIDPKDKNMYFIGMSSGKLNSFLSCGIPIVMPNYFPGFVDLKKKCDVGEFFENAEDIPDIVRKISNRYGFYFEDIKSFYIKEIEFNEKFNQLYNNLGRL